MVEHSGFEAASRSLHSLGQLRNSRIAALSFAILLYSAGFRFVFSFGEQPTGLTLSSAPPTVTVSVLQVRGSN